MLMNSKKFLIFLTDKKLLISDIKELFGSFYKYVFAYDISSCIKNKLSILKSNFHNVIKYADLSYESIKESTLLDYVLLC